MMMIDNEDDGDAFHTYHYIYIIDQLMFAKLIT